MPVRHRRPRVPVSGLSVPITLLVQSVTRITSDSGDVLAQKKQGRRVGYHASR